jgi:cysteine desulfurase
MDKTVYLDYAATTPLRKEVKEYMVEVMEGPFGNPSSTHSFGRKSRIVVEQARKYIAKALGCTGAEIIFTSGGTEADNAALLLSVRDLGVKRIITSRIEHHAVLHTAESLARNYNVQLDFVALDEQGGVRLDDLERLLKEEQPTLVSLMHGNNEIGNLLDLVETGNLCHQYGAYFHSDTVQTIGHFPIDLSTLPIDFVSASAHKFYGPKGVGFLYANSRVKIASFITGGAQERNMRGGTENIIGLAGLHKALEYSLENLQAERKHIAGLKAYFIGQLQTLEGVVFNGYSNDMERSLYTVVSAGFPTLANNSMFLFSLDLKGIAVSGGSACASGSLKGSHVMAELTPDATHPVVRFSFGKDTTKEELDFVLANLSDLLKP